MIGVRSDAGRRPRTTPLGTHVRGTTAKPTEARDGRRFVGPPPSVVGMEVPVRETNDEAPAALVATGIPGLDDVLGGGFTPNRVYLIEGNPGSGKTTLAVRWLLEGERLGE